jgi:hypothetical protein
LTLERRLQAIVVVKFRTGHFEAIAMEFFYQAKVWMIGVKGETWRWFSTLSQQEWMVILGIIAALGFLCMRNFTQRGTL